MKVLTEGLTELESPHLTGTLSHFFPPARGNINQLESWLSGFGLVLPTFSQKISIDYDAYVGNRNNGYSAELRHLSEVGVGYVRTAVLCDEEGMYAVDLASVNDLKNITVEQIKEMLGDAESIEGVDISRDRKAGFAPYGTMILEEQPHKNLARNGGIIVLARDMSQVEKLVRVSEKLEYLPYFYALRVSGGVERRFVGLDSDWVGDRLVVDCCCRGGGAVGFASGVRKTSEAGSQNSGKK